ncbi:MAG: hypothetical protein WD250_07265 [Egibacteraceae bacterium]
MTRAGALVTLAVVGLMLAAASVAFACTGQAQLYDITPARALPGETVTVGGSLFGDQPVELRLNSPAGALLETARGPSFNMPVQIPADVAPGPYYVVAVEYDPATGAIAEQRAKGFEVLAAETTPEPDPDPVPEPDPDPVPDQTQPPAGSDPMTTRGADTQPSAPDASAPPAPTAPDPAPPAVPDTAAPQPQPSTPEPAAGPDDSPAPAPAPVAPAPQPAEGQPVTPGASDDGQRVGAVTPPAADPAPAASAPSPASSSTPSGGDAPAADASATDETAAPAQSSGQEGVPAGVQARRPNTNALTGTDTDAPSARSGAADLWSGFAADDAALAPGIDEPAAAGDAGMGPVALAAGLLGAGLIVLVAAGTTLVVRRRRVLVSNRASDHRGDA